MTKDTQKKSKWLSLQKAIDLINKTDASETKKKSALENLVEGVKSGAIPFQIPPTRIEVKGIDLIINGSWMTMKAARDHVVIERKIRRAQAKTWILDELKHNRMRWRAKAVIINGVTLDPAETERWLRSQGGEYVPWSQ